MDRAGQLLETIEQPIWGKLLGNWLTCHLIRKWKQDGHLPPSEKVCCAPESGLLKLEATAFNLGSFISLLEGESSSCENHNVRLQKG